MIAEVNENDIVKHWGIWVKAKEEFDAGWLVLEDGLVYATTCPRVANVQHDAVIKLSEYTDEDLEVREIT